MDYNQPYGTSTGAPYVNGNPATGTVGSIPPAAAIENPQREIVNLINDCGLTPSNSNLHQLAQAVQSGQLFYGGVTTSVGNVFSAALIPALTSPKVGQHIILKMNAAPTAACSLILNALGASPISRRGGGPIVGYEWSPNDFVIMVWTGTSWQLETGPMAGQPSYLQANATYYVNGTTGSDSYDGLSATVTGGHGPFATIQKACDIITLFNLNGYNVTVNVADYSSYAKVSLPRISGSGTVYIVGNVTTPSNCVVTANQGVCFNGYDGEYDISGFKVVSLAASSSEPSAGFFSRNNCRLIVSNIDFGQCQAAHIQAEIGQVTIKNGNITISGSAPYHLYALRGGLIVNVPNTVDYFVPSAVTFTDFTFATQLGEISLTYHQFNNAGNVTTRRYNASLNGVINTGGGGANYFPGATAGVTSSGGQYV